MRKAFPRHDALLFIPLWLLMACGGQPANESRENSDTASGLFTLVSPDSSNVDFQNELTEGPNANVLMYEYLYNGGGVAASDFNNDGQTDLYFTSNMGDNKLYLNTGNWKFEDVTEVAGVSGRPGPWKTGISAADVNGDGLMDLYLCYSGALPPGKRANQLFINTGNDAQGVPKFEEKAAEFGLASEAFSNQGYFFDYDRDGDLDMILLNHNPKSLPILNVASTREFLKKDDPLQGLRLYRQDNGKFADVTVQANISGSALSYGLGVGISDLNGDGWLDFYVSNDYAVPDYLYMNQGDGTFLNDLVRQLGHTSHFSMGNDIADVNNDGQQDIFTLDMLPEDNKRQKLLLSPDNYDKFDLNVRSGFHYQYMRNMLQLNNGEGGFSEVGQLAGISNTDWSWAALLADFNNDGWKDLFVSNGYLRDYTNLDFINYMEDYVQAKGRLLREDVLEIVGNMPSSNLTNYLFRNRGEGIFEDVTSAYGLDQPANSNGAAYADLDNDGDLDLVVNNINKPAFLYRNDSNPEAGNYLQLELQGNDANTQGIGARVNLYQKGSVQSIVQMPTRGYLSTVSPILHFGLGADTVADSLLIQWNTGEVQSLVNVRGGQRLLLKQGDASQPGQVKTPEEPLFREVPSPIDYTSTASPFNDFKRQSLLISQFSHTSPAMARGDINGDGLDDIFIGGVKGEAGAVFIQRPEGKFIWVSQPALEKDSQQHDSGVAIFDANGDGHADLYVCSGGYHDYEAGDSRLQDRLYLGDGKGGFVRSASSLPEMYSSTETVAVGDANGDGSPDIFVGGRVVPGRYPETPKSYLLINDGKGNFKRASSLSAAAGSGMVTDAIWVDLDNDNIKELVVAGEWMPVKIYSPAASSLQDVTDKFLASEYSGWWNTITASDFNGDGRADLLLGNMGTNTQFEITQEQPAELHYADFDDNGSLDPIFSFYIQGKSYPYVTRDELLGQLAYLRSKFTTYASFANARLPDILSQQQLEKANRLVATHMKTSLFLSTPAGGYQLADLPVEAQYAPVYAQLAGDYNGDGFMDILLFGNNQFFKLRLGRFDANYGSLLLGDGKGNFSYVPQARSGLAIKGDVRAAVQMGDLILLGIYGEAVKALRINQTENNVDDDKAL